MAAATSAFPNRAAHSRPNTFEQKRTAASTCVFGLLLDGRPQESQIAFALLGVSLD
jgi:hypothetical protein